MPELAITARRAETLKARAYDGDLARIAVPGGADVGWLRAVADPADDLRMPDERAVSIVARRARRSAPRGDCAGEIGASAASGGGGACAAMGCVAAAEHGLTMITLDEAGPELLRLSPLAFGGVGPAADGGIGCGPGAYLSARKMAAKNIMPSKSAGRTGPSLCWRGCIRPVLPAMCWAV